MTAHPKIDPVTGELLFFGYELLGEPYLRFHVADRNGQLIRSADVPLPAPRMIHDFNVTEHYVVWMDLPVVFDLNLAAGGEFPFTWRPEAGARLGVMERSGDGGDLRWFEIEPCWVYHPLNAYEEGDTVVIDFARFPHLFASGTRDPMEGDPTLHRWTIDPRAGRVREEGVHDRPQEFPRVDPRRATRRHRYGYTVANDAILKHDFDRGSVAALELGPTSSDPSEALFVPSGDAEDDGWLLSIVHDRPTDTSRLLVLSAQDLSSGPVASVHLPRRVPAGFHACWLPT
jgi:carotenoid cleavage dioxygenase